MNTSHMFDEPLIAGDRTVPRLKTGWTSADRHGAFAVRWNIGRMTYLVEPGIYAIGSPTGESPVLVTANYKLTVDIVRRDLAGTDVWLLVLDTKGVNVWCAAGKGTFGTDELVTRIEATRIGELVTHRKIILPQLGAPGVSAREIKQRSGFLVTYGPVRSADLVAYLSAGCRADEKMRQVTFDFGERMAVVPVELSQTLPYLAVTLLIAVGLSVADFTLAAIFREYLPFLTAIITGVLLFPALLPVLPFRSFALGGALTGLAGAAVLWPVLSWNLSEIIRNTTIITVVSSFFALNFTGASTFTSPSGVKKELGLALPVMLAVLGSGVATSVLVHLLKGA